MRSLDHQEVGLHPRGAGLRRHQRTHCVAELGRVVERQGGRRLVVRVVAMIAVMAAVMPGEAVVGVVAEPVAWVVPGSWREASPWGCREAGLPSPEGSAVAPPASAIAPWERSAQGTADHWHLWLCSGT